MNTIVVPKIENCARCGGNHKNLIAKKFKNPVSINEFEHYNYWTMCPANKEPVLIYADKRSEQNGNLAFIN